MAYYDDDETAYDDAYAAHDGSLEPECPVVCSCPEPFTVEACEPWSTPEDVANCCNLQHEIDGETFEEWLTIATDWLSALLGYRFGVCRTSYRPPCGPTCSSCPTPGVSPALDVRQYRTAYVTADGHGAYACNCTSGGGGCGCPKVCEIALPFAPVVCVHRVVVDGETLDASQWSITDGRWLARTDGDCWPACQDPVACVCREGTWGVDYSFGVRPPLMAVRAVEQLAVEIGKACLADKSCSLLPYAVAAINRQGVSMQMRDRLAEAQQRLTGVPLVDAVVQAYNPQGLLRRPRVLSRDRNRRMYRVGR